MSDNEYEAFEITDYDLENEFNINRPRRISKNQQIYGIWARDEDSDNEGDRPSFKGSRKPKNYTAPIGFVAGGVQQAGKKEEKKEDDDDDDNDPDAKIHLHGSSSSDDEPRMSSFKGDILSSITDEIAGLRKKTKTKYNPLLSQRGVGTWERHTKGIGAKLLLQMGYQPGKGLGKDLQGIQAPIEANLRKGRGAIGAYGPEKAQKIADIKPEAKSESKDGDKISQWRKSGDSKPKKTKYVYKSIEDVLDQNYQPVRKREFNELSKVKVIDMTGPEQRVLSGYHAISGTQKPSDEWEIRKEKEFKNFQLPELQHNLNLLVDMCEQDIVTSDRALRYNEDRVVSLENEVVNLQKVTLQEETVISGLQHILDVLERLTSTEANLNLDEIAAAYEELQEKQMTDYMIYDLASLAPSLVRPLLKTELASWDPLSEPHKPIPILQRWKKIFERTQSAGPLAAAPTLLDPYHRLLWDAWMPCIRIAVNAWNVKVPDPMIDLLQTWHALVPPWILDNILQQLIMPRIQHTADEWNPLTDTIPVHTWLHPWLPQLGKRLRVSVFPVIRQKLASALTSWHPSDNSARLMLQPWVSVFTQQELDTFLINNIIPKLAHVLQEFVINPAQQSLDSWNWVMDWVEVIPPQIMADVLEKSFFPKWLQVLTMWLNMAPNYDQVTEWYSGWKSLIPPALRDQQQIKDQLRTALDMMSRSVGGGSMAAPPPMVQPPPPPVIHSDVRYQNMQQGIAEAVRTASQMIEGFKELVQKRCEERGIVFLPLPNRYREGKQIYRCGLLQIYIDRNVLFYSDNGANWNPISLQALLDKAVSGV
ncbi:unnamed protein product [Nezara viridula]|uniref:G-patch domain-containing protein n=1 Tax=Nezara viridula TaxID=85310 RepID=A0A9P0EE62_NEZVI|nr:unnamed protein product [Nezara viridula]